MMTLFHSVNLWSFGFSISFDCLFPFKRLTRTRFCFSIDLQNPLLDISKEDFNTTLSISTYSLLSLTKAMQPLLSPSSSITALSFLGSTRYFQNYGIMSIAKAALESTALQLAGDLGSSGIRVNVIRAAPVNTLAARGIPRFLVEFDRSCECRK